MKLLAALALAATLAAPALADTHRYVSRSGSNSNNGETPGAAWRTIAFANANLPAANTANGNVWLHVGLGDFQEGGSGAFPNPAIPASDGSRYFYVGANLGDPAATVLPGGTLNKPYTSIKGFKIFGNVTLDSTACRDTLASNLVTGDFSCTGDYTVIDGNTFTGRRKMLLGFRDSAPVLTDGLIFRNNTALDLGKDINGPTTQGILVFGGGNSGSTAINSKTDSMVFERNNIGVTANPNVDAFAIVWYFCDDFLSQYNTYNVTWNSDAYGDKCMRVRSHSNNVTFNGDVFLVGGDNAANLALSSHSGDAADGTAFTKNLTMDSCLVIGQRVTPIFQSGMRFATVTYNTFVTASGTALSIQCGAADTVVGRNRIEHNTFISGKDHNPYARGLVSFLDTKFGADSTLFYSNLIYGFAPGTRVNVYGTNAGQSTLAGLAVALSTGSSSGLFKHDWNLYNVWPYRDVPGDRSVDINGTIGVPTGRSKWGPAWLNQGGPDTTFALFDRIDSPKIGASSFAIAMAKDSTDAGAHASEFYPIITVTSGVPIVMDWAYGTVTTANFTLANVGTATLDITSITSNTTELGVPVPVDISADDNHEFMITYSPDQPNPTTRPIITIRSNDPAFPVIELLVVLNGALIEDQ